MALNIGQVAKVTGMAARTIRYYEEVGVLPSPYRTAAGYRQYTEDGVQQLLFIRRARALGLSLRHLRALTTALDGGRRGPARPRVREVVRAHLSTVQGQISELRLLEGQLQQVLRRMRAPSRKASGGRCRCLELSGAGTHSDRPAGSVHRR
jgi:DNA-binding transcriptional MerR regulator